MQIYKRKRRVKLTVLFCSIAAALLLGYWALNMQLRPALLEIARVRANALTSDAMYSTVLDCLAVEDALEPFVSVQSEEGQVYFVELNNRALTQFASACAQEAQTRLDMYGRQGISISLGTLSGIPLLAGAGPSIHMTFHPETNTQAYISSEFRAAGINQTLHKVMLRLEAQIAIILPAYSETIRCFVDVPVAEHVIVGQVPELYADMGSRPEMLNLIPNG